MDFIGMKIAKGDTTDVNTAALQDLILHSDHPFLKIKEIGTGSYTYSNDDTDWTTTIANHGLEDYEPLCIVMIQWYDINAGVKRTSFRRAPFYDSLLDGAVYFNARPYIDGPDLKLSLSSFDGNGGSYELDYVYLIYYDPDDNP